MREPDRYDRVTLTRNVLPATACPLSVVMPVYNEEDSVTAAVEDVRACILDLVPGSELWVVDDGSRDRTAGILDHLAAADPRLHIVHQPNGGHGAALLAGLAQARGEWMLLVDVDRQIPLDTFNVAWERRRGLDALFGQRVDRHDPLVRKLVTMALGWQVRLIFGARLADPNAPFKLVRSRLVDAARKVTPDDCLIPSVFLAVHAYRAGWRIAGFDIAYRKRAAGQTSLRKLKLLKFSARSFVQLVAFRRVRIERAAAMDLPMLVVPQTKDL
jgi:glycosyltransferase involved in cell wall biosynthesis